MNRGIILGGLALLVLAGAGGAYFFLKKGAGHTVGASEHAPAADGTAAGATAKDALDTDEGGGIADDASGAVDAVEEGAEEMEGGETPENASASGDVFGDADGAAMHDENPDAADADERAPAERPN